jgi:hypothetical protein
MLEGWNIGGLLWSDPIIPPFHYSKRKDRIMEKQQTGERKNINRGFKQLRVWQDAIELYLLAMKMSAKFPFEMKRTASNAIDAAHSISRNIAEGYCRRSLLVLDDWIGSRHSIIPLFHYANDKGMLE